MLLNGSPDGSPGLRLFREKVIEALTAKLTPEMLEGSPFVIDDGVQYVIERYQLNHGQGDPHNNPEFNDLHDEAFQVLLEDATLFQEKRPQLEVKK